MTKISQLSDIGANLAANDEFIIRDVSDASTPNKKVTSSGFADYIITQGTGSGFTQIAAGVGPLARVLATSSGTTGTLTFSTAAATTLIERARIDSSGNVKIGGTLPSSPNIELNADGSAEFAGSVSIGGTAAANTIDEYEVGSYTPAFNAGTYSYAFQIGSYVKIGKLVTVIFDLQVSSVTSATTGTIQINLPFTNNNVSGGGIMYPNGTLSVATNFANSTEANTIQAGNNVALVSVKLLYGTGSGNTAQYQDLQANSRISGSITYTTIN